ncbi:hypothetical protein N7537_004610 [Penicillium hordei]|uniref:Uncharacterized protein n=1 Tax=Penicillium hordei TaxID=40994 RepID=A0AAD6H518_9EURO|nr:uncharacterized protein N7537_004610 [Penicillium hordei]KAJ5607991.1 hypothetical protein N7537_004610 [Penicillium hordei]
MSLSTSSASKANVSNHQAVIIDKATIHYKLQADCKSERAKQKVENMIPTTTKDFGGSPD